MRYNPSLFVYIFAVMLFLCGPVTANFSSNEQVLAKLYSQNQSELLWFDQRGVTLNGMTLIKLLDDLGEEVDKSLPIKNPQSRLKADIQYSKLLLELIERKAHITKTDLQIEQTKFLQAINAGHLSSYLDNILPPFDETYRLRGMIRAYKKKTKFVWPSVEQYEFRLGQSSDEVKRLRWMLTALGDLEHNGLTRYRESIYDPMVIDGIKSFQQRHGLNVNGNLDRETVNALNINPLERVKQMQHNLWRLMTWSATSDSGKFVWINIPGYQLTLYENRSVALRMKVIIGKPNSPTPRLTTHLTQITVNPTWTPPASIVRAELLPLNRKEPGYLNHQRFELHGIGINKTQVIKLEEIDSEQLPSLLSQYRLVQAPGDDNALGKMRFTILNRHSIYLHDTPAKQLFERNMRALSHGCIRLEKPELLSSYLMETIENKRGVRKAMRGTATQYFSLVQPIPVYITYHTSWVDDSGKLQLRPDIYKLDLEI